MLFAKKTQKVITMLSFIHPEYYLNRLRKKIFSLKRYNNYYDALKDCGIKDPYQDDDLINAVFEKTKIFKDCFGKACVAKLACQEMSILTAVLCAMNNKQIRILDFGGACGAHYFIIRNFFDSHYDFKWVVVETKKMCQKAKVFESDELVFKDDFESAKNNLSEIDLLCVSGVIQYLEEPYKGLNTIIDSSARYILFNRMSMTTGNSDIISIQRSMLSAHGIGELPKGFKNKDILFPNTIIQKSRFYEMLCRRYKVIYEINDNSGLHGVNDERIAGLGLFCKLKKE